MSTENAARADDIVSRLRLAREQVHTMPNSAARLYGEAADEIERLRPAPQTSALPPLSDTRDALRYRWLRSRDLDTIHRGGVFAGLTPANMVINGDDLDAAVDAAMGVAPQPSADALPGLPSILSRIAFAAEPEGPPAKDDAYEEAYHEGELAAAARVKAAIAALSGSPVSSAAPDAVREALTDARRRLIDLRDEATVLRCTERVGKRLLAEAAGDAVAAIDAALAGSAGDGWPPPRSMDDYVKDGTLVLLLVGSSDDYLDDNPTADADRWLTVGSNNFEHDDQDEWRFAGWDWSQDCWTEGRGKPLGWWPLPDLLAPPSPVPAAIDGEQDNG